MSSGRCILMAVILILVTSVSLFAQQGGLYISQIQVMNDNQIIFERDTKDGNVKGWYLVSDATPLSVNQNPPSYLLWMNSHGKNKSNLGHYLKVNPIGVLELKAMVYIMPAKDQFEWQKNVASIFSMGFECDSAPQSAMNAIRIDTTLEPKENGCRIGIKHYFSPRIDTYTPSKQQVVPTEKWVTLTLRLDQKTGTASVLVDKDEVSSAKYDPADFPKVDSISFSTNFGDGSLQVGDNSPADNQAIAETLLQSIWNADPGLDKFKAIDAVVKKAKDGDDSLRKAVLTLAIKAMNDNTRGILDRWPCCYVIGGIGEEQGMPELIQVLLNDPSDTMRAVAVEALGKRYKSGSQEAHDALLESAKKETSARVRETLKRYLGSEMPK